MGGASSRFEQTQWWNADGELIPASASKRKLQEENDFHTTIIPTESPTKSLQIFDIIKCKGITSQRDFEIRDGNQKVIFVTRPVPGTMAWFDLLRPGSADEPELNEADEEKVEEEKETTNTEKDSRQGWGEEITEDTTTPEQAPPPRQQNDDELLLRVQVDENRRTWIIYSYTPVFQGQLPAMLPERKGLEEGLKLYKSCCITLSWSKYLALAARYGPPTKLQDFWEEGDDDEDHSEHESEPDASFVEKIMFTKADTIAAKKRDDDVNLTAEQIRAEQKVATSPKEGSNFEEEKDTIEDNGAIGSLANSVKTLLGPGDSHKAKQLTKKERLQISLEGVVDLNAPLLQCQQVLKTKANFQTRTVEKEEAVKLYMLDDAWKKAKYRRDDASINQDPNKSPLAKAITYEKEALQPHEDMDVMKKWFSDKYVDQDQMTLTQDDASTTTTESTETKEEGGKETRRNLMQRGKQTWFSFRMPKTSPTDSWNGSTSLNEDGDSFSDIADEKEDERMKDDPKTKVYGSKMGVATIQDDDPDRKEPLVAYWQWKNTYTRHKIQMHLAKNSDLALHAIMSIILNICRYEWH